MSVYTRDIVPLFGGRLAHPETLAYQWIEPVMTSTTPASITLQKYAGIVVLVDEGHPLPDVLAVEQVAPDAWDDIDVTFKDRLSQEPELFSEYARHVVEAEDALHRSVSPLESDPAAYLAFVGAFAASEPAAMLETHALNLADIARLGRLWEGRFAADERLRREAFEAAKSMAPPAALQVAVAELRPLPWTEGQATPPAQPAIGSPSLSRHPPSDDPLARTLDPSVLPSAYRPSRAASSAPHSAAPCPAPAPASSAWTPPTPPAPSPWTPPAAAAPAPAPSSLVIPAAPSRSPLEPLASLGHTMPHARAPQTAPTPFRGERGAPAPVARGLEPHAALGATAPLSNKPPSSRALPFGGLEPNAALGGTAPLRRAPTGPATPFTGSRPAPPRASLEPNPMLGSTVPTPAPTPVASPHPPARPSLEPNPMLGGTVAMPAPSPAASPRPPARPSLEPNPLLGGTVVMPKKPDST